MYEFNKHRFEKMYFIDGNFSSGMQLIKYAVHTKFAYESQRLLGVYILNCQQTISAACFSVKIVLLCSSYMRVAVGIIMFNYRDKHNTLVNSEYTYNIY